MPAKKDDDKVKAEEPSNPAVDAHKADAPKGHDDDLTDGGRAAPAVANPDPKAKSAEAREHDKDVDPAVLPDNLEPAMPEWAPAPAERIEDLLKDKTFDRDGKVRVQLARLLSAGHEMAPPELVAMGR